MYAQALTGFIENYIPTAPGSCFAFLVQGMTLIWYIHCPSRNRARLFMALAATSSVFGLLAFTGLFTNLNLTLEANIFFLSKYLGSFPTKVTSPLTGALFSLSGSTLVLLLRYETRRRFVLNLISGMAGLVAITGLVGAISYMYGTLFLYRSGIIPASFMTYIGFMFLGVGLLAAAGPDGFLLSPLTGGSVRAVLLRTFIPLAFIAVLISDILQHAVTKFNSAIVSGASVVFFGMLTVFFVIRAARLIGGAMDADDTARKKAEQRIVQQKDFLNTVVESLPYPFYVIDAYDYTVKMANCAGAPDGLLPHITCHELTHKNAVPCHEDSCVCPIEVIKETGQPTITEHRHYDKDGEARHVEIHAYPIFDSGGDIVQIIEYVLDISGRKQAEEALRKSEAMYRTLVKNIPQKVFMKDTDSSYVSINEHLARDFGIRPADVFGKTDYDFFPRKLADKYRANDKRIMKTGVSEELEVHNLSPGKGVWVKTFKTPVRDVNGRIVGVFGIFWDITERKRAETALKASEEKYRELVQSANSIILRMDVSGKVTFFNEFAQVFFGYSEDEMLGKNVVGTIVPELESTGRDLRAMIEDIGVNPDRYMNNVNENMLRNGERVWVSWTNKPVFGENGLIREILCVGNDITERKRGEEERKKLEEQLFQAQKMESVGRLAGGVAHDFNNMLGVIIGRAEMALQQDVSNDKLQHNLKEILKAAQRSADLTKQLLAFARKQTAVRKILDLNSTISSMLNMLRRLIGEDIDLSWQPGLDLWKVKIDPSQVDQILANLAVNARDAVSGVGAVTIKAENVVIDDSNSIETPEFIPGEYVLLSMSDTGTGMSEEVREKIFEPFFTTKELGKGTGLGLSTVYGIVKQNDGFIYVESEPGKGTTFKIYLQRFEPEAAQVPSEHAAVKRLTGTETILLVEDDEAVLDLSKMMLEKLGYTVLAAHTHVHAMHLVKEHPRDIHLLITDVVMPEMNGRELAEQLRVIRPNLKCLYMSGYTADAIAHHGILDEGLDFIQKPFGNDDLAAKVRHVLDHLV
jgi:PAS domain S-box-containing protein